MNTRILSPGDGIGEAVALLAAGETVGLPTETVYGLAADALDPLACSRIFEAKKRPLTDPLIVHLPDRSWLDILAIVSPLAEELAAAFWPGPLTMVLPRRDIVPDIVTAGQDTVALRMSTHPVFQAIVGAFGKPVAAPSANRFGRISPTDASHVLKELRNVIPLIVDGGPCLHGIESTIVQVLEDEMRILRHGPVTMEDLGRFGRVAAAQPGILAPGGLKSHYAPRTPLEIGWATGRRDKSRKVGLLAWTSQGEGYDHLEFLSGVGDLHEAAANLYGAMRRLDEAGLDLIVAEPVPEVGLGVAIMDRLRKAAARE